jgi:hypothetical protein
MSAERTAVGRHLVEIAQIALGRGKSILLVLTCHSAGLEVKEITLEEGGTIARVLLDAPRQPEIVWFVALDQIAAVTVRD